VFHAQVVNIRLGQFQTVLHAQITVLLAHIATPLAKSLAQTALLIHTYLQMAAVYLALVTNILQEET
jgi:hypothetical protein